MEKQLLIFALGAMLLLSGCRRAERPTPETAAALYRGARVRAEIAVSAGGEYPADYGVSVVCAEGGESAAEITAPADVAGVRAVLTDGTARLAYDGAALETFLPALPGYVPADVLTGLVTALAQAAPVEWGYETLDGVPALAITYQDDFPSVTGLRRVWLREADLALLQAECYLDDSMMLRVRCDSFALTPAE